MIAKVLYFRVRNNIRAYVGDVDAAAVPCGFGRAIGNKVSRTPSFLLIFFFFIINTLLKKMKSL